MSNSSDKFDRTVLEAAAGDDIDQLVQALATHGHLIDAPDPDDLRNWTPMHIAAQKGNVPAIETLVRMGSKAIDTPNERNGYTPMFAAACSGHVPAIETLVRLGSNAIDTPNKNGWTPLRAAAFNGHVSVIETLVRLGSNAIDTPNNNDCTPVFTAVLWRKIECVRVLKALGDNPTSPIEAQEQTIELTEDEVAELRYRVYFDHSLLHRLLFSC